MLSSITSRSWPSTSPVTSTWSKSTPNGSTGELSLWCVKRRSRIVNASAWMAQGAPGAVVSPDDKAAIHRVKLLVGSSTPCRRCHRTPSTMTPRRCTCLRSVLTRQRRRLRRRTAKSVSPSRSHTSTPRSSAGPVKVRCTRSTWTQLPKASVAYAPSRPANQVCTEGSRRANTPSMPATTSASSTQAIARRTRPDHFRKGELLRSG